MKHFTLSLLTLLMRLSAQLPDLDEFSREIDLSSLEPDESQLAPRENDPLPPPAHLFAGMEVLLPLPHVREGMLTPLDGSDCYLLQLPAADYLVVPNPPRLDTAYKRLADTLAEMGNPEVFPLKVVLHADSKFSVAIALTEGRDGSLPLGVDSSPLPPVTLLGVLADIQLLQKTHPPLLQAYQAIRRYAWSSGLELDTTEFYALPREPGQVFFALQIKTRP